LNLIVEAYVSWLIAVAELQKMMGGLG
jgi:hypothetical protein